MNEFVVYGIYALAALSFTFMVIGTFYAFRGWCETHLWMDPEAKSLLKQLKSLKIHWKTSYGNP